MKLLVFSRSGYELVIVFYIGYLSTFPVSSDRGLALQHLGHSRPVGVWKPAPCEGPIFPVIQPTPARGRHGKRLSSIYPLGGWRDIPSWCVQTQKPRIELEGLKPACSEWDRPLAVDSGAQVPHGKAQPGQPGVYGVGAVLSLYATGIFWT